MKQKIVMQMQLDCDKCRSKALKIAAQEKGVSSVALEGDSNDKLVVIGDVDAVCLGRVLRKKFRCVALVSVEEVKKKEDDKKDDKKDDDKKNCKIEEVVSCYYTPNCPPPLPPCGPPYHYTVYDTYGSNCSLM